MYNYTRSFIETIMPENTDKQQGTRFKKGVSGNPNGRPIGARNKASLLAEKLLSENIEDICTSVVESAISGNMQAAKIILDRLLPTRKDSPVNLKLPTIKSSKDIIDAISTVTKAVSKGVISPMEGEAIAKILNFNAAALEMHDFDNRLAQLENKDT